MEGGFARADAMRALVNVQEGSNAMACNIYLVDGIPLMARVYRTCAMPVIESVSP